MSEYTLSNRAVDDLTRIYQYTVADFGIEQADAYLNGMQECFNLLASKPKIANNVTDIRAGYLRYLYRKHSIFFKVRTKDIFIVRVLHQQMKYELHLTS
ncbi:type II toxin-antitoxin system RelE/ParE family toxin [Thalassotalea sp. ND16A]|uniref:type II toxin-antitoxin system RelE/ParE family toxin n=1 Tax=Thalassotalea sp. ND16A TaxID=1535422 RepID=UPI000519FA5B|nr:type II toxin-antitoxin system RelE/ParE family toxin [Thalassotalea sp. ND16A]KGJ97130.1 hypothetical protein ND16A_0052 [Thalassotalea sp. ND16A]